MPGDSSHHNSGGFIPFVDPSEKWLRVWFGACAVALLAEFLLDSFLDIGLGFTVLSVTFAVALAAAVSVQMTGRSAVRTLRKLNYRLCPDCRYILNRLPDAGFCPECGRAYSADELKKLWTKAYRIREAPNPEGVNTPSTPSPHNSHTPPASPTPPPGASTN